MPSISAPQLTLNFEPSLPDRFRTLREFIAHRATMHQKPLKTIAADMDMAPSTLTRKLNPGEGDTQRFNLDDLEAYLASTEDACSVIEYLAAKYMQCDKTRKAAALSRVEALAAELSQAMAVLKGAEA